MYSDEQHDKIVMGMRLELHQEQPDLPDPDEGAPYGWCSQCGELVETVSPDGLEHPIVCVVCCEERGDT